MMLGPLASDEHVAAVRRAFGWPPTWEEWGASPEALAAQEAMAGQFPGLDVEEE